MQSYRYAQVGKQVQNHEMRVVWIPYEISHAMKENGSITADIVQEAAVPI